MLAIKSFWETEFIDIKCSRRQILENISRSFLTVWLLRFCMCLSLQSNFSQGSFSLYNHNALNTIKSLCWIAANYIFPRVTFLLLNFWTFYVELLVQMNIYPLIHSTSILSECFGQFRNVDNWKQFLTKDKVAYLITKSFKRITEIYGEHS